MTNPLENKINSAAESVEPSAEFSQDLWNHIRSTPRNGHGPKRISRFVWIPALTVLGILVVMILVSPQTVLAAVKGLLAYLPGVGFVEKNDSTLYLAEPVVIEQGGYTFSLDQVVADTNKVSIAYHIVSPTATFVHCAYSGNSLIWSNGRSNHPIGGGGFADEGNYSAQIDYLPLPEGETSASIKVTNDSNEPGCTAPGEWTLPFTLGTDAPGTDLLPVVVSNEEQPATSLVSQSQDSPIKLTLDTVDELSDGYLLVGHIDFDQEYWMGVSIRTNTLYAVDANGKNVLLERGDSVYRNNGFALKIIGKNFAAPLSIHVKDLNIQVYDDKSSSFSFDAGSDPQPGQSWKIETQLLFAGKKFLVQDVKVINGDYDFDPKTVEIAYGISMKLPEGFGVLMDCVGQDGVHSIGNVAKPVIGDVYTAEVDYAEGIIPTGPVTCKGLNASYLESGDWQFDWQPPVTTPAVPLSSSSSDSSVQFIIDKYVEMTDGYLLTGHMIAQDASWRQISINIGTMVASDATGKNVPLEQSEESLHENEFAIKIASKEFTAPLTFHVEQLDVNAFEDKGSSFSFDAGDNALIGQSWKINQELEIGEMKILVKEVEVINELNDKGLPTGKMGFAMKLNYAERVDPYIFCEDQSNGASSSDGTKPLGGNDYIFNTIYNDGLPQGTVYCTLTNVLFHPSGNWLFEWQPASAAN